LNQKTWFSASNLWIALVVITALAAPYLAPYNPLEPVGRALSPPSSEFILGTDALGRDLLSRLLYGSRLSLGSSCLAALLTILIGGFVGLIAASAPRWLDRTLLWIANALLAIPGLLLAMLLVASMGPRMLTIVLAVGLGGAPGFARMSRTVFRQIRTQGYIQAAKALGGGEAWIAHFHILPNAAPHIFSLGTIHIAWAFLGTTTLTFLGLSGDPALPEWGAMLNAGRLTLRQAPIPAILPGLMISLTVLSIYSLGAWLVDQTDPLREHAPNLH